MKKDYRKLVAKGRVFLATTECEQFDRAEDLFVFLDTVLDKELNLRIGRVVKDDISKLIFLPEILREEVLKRKVVSRVHTATFYEKSLGWLCGVCKFITRELGLPKDFGVGIVHYTGRKERVKKEDGSYSERLVFSCYSFTPEIIDKVGDDFLLFLDELKKFMRHIESCNQDKTKEIIKSAEVDISGWNNDVSTCKLIEVKVEESTDAEEIQSLEDLQEKVKLFLIEYVMNLCDASKTSVDNVTYTPKSYLLLHATKNNHTKIKLSPSQMAMYCYIQGFKSYGISKRRLIEDINSHSGRYRKLSMLFCATHTDYDMARLKVVVTQINSKIRTELAKANEGQEAFDFTLWTEKLLIKSRNKQRYYIGVSERRFKPVIVDENRRFVESPDEFIDRL